MIQHKLATGLILKYLEYNKFNAWTSYWGVIYYLNETLMKNKCLQIHELTHVAQIKRDGILKFSIMYTYYTIKYGYRANPYEIEAYDMQFKCGKGE